MRRKVGLVGLACAVAALALAAVLLTPPDHAFRFARSGGQFTISGAGVAVLERSGARLAGSGHGPDVVGVPQAAAPAGMTTQVLKFRFRSRGFFSAEPGAHFAVGVTGAWRKDNPATPARDGLLVGRGVVIGNVSAATQGCAAAPVVQVESFRRTGNALFPHTCSARLEDGAWYGLTVSADRAGGIRYILTDADDKVIGAAGVSDAGADVPPDLGGWWLLHVFSSRHPDRDWAVDIADFQVTWLAGPLAPR